MGKEEVTQFYKKLDRSLFIDNEYKQSAEIDAPLPIGFGQTISQPSLVLNMTIELELDKTCRVLEIGTGSGYQTALLAQFAGEVYTVEYFAELSVKAQERLKKLGYENVFYKVGDGSEGWEEHAPYERIITTAAAGSTPEKLLQQLAPGGIAIMPVGSQSVQDLLKITKDEDSGLNAISLGGVRFVEMRGRYGWNSSNDRTW